MSNRTVAAYQRLYDTPEDLELFSAGLAENPVPGGLLGPTFTCIIGRQFHNIRVGDRWVWCGVKSPLYCDDHQVLV